VRCIRISHDGVAPVGAFDVLLFGLLGLVAVDVGADAAHVVGVVENEPANEGELTSLRTAVGK
jgi:hypothetical protein